VSQQNIDVLRRVMDAIGRRHIDDVLCLVTADVEWIAARSAFEGTFHGHEGMRRFCQDNFESFEVFRLGKVEELRDLGDRVLAIGTIRIRGRGGGVEIEAPVAGIASFDNGRLSRWEDFRDRELAVEAAGLAE
jgi:ketosteroid isomerase-like protein